MSTAALSTATALCLVLGVHWPSDVLAAICLGAFITLLISVAFDRRRAGTRPSAASDS